MHVEALFTHDARGRMLRVNELGGRALAPRVFFGRTRHGHVLRVRSDVRAEAMAELEAIARTEPRDAPTSQRPHCGAALRAVLARYEPIRRVWAGPAYRIDAAALPDVVATQRVESDDDPLMATFPEWRGEVSQRQPFVVAVDDGRAVAVCCSVRITPVAHAAGVETLPDARRRGFASRAVVAWAKAVAESGAVPLYSTSWDNGASQAVARRLGMHRYGIDFHAT